MFAIAFPVGAVLAAILVLLPSPAHWRARNVAAISLFTWVFLMNVIYTVNSLVWSSNSLPQHLMWCDISTCFFRFVLTTNILGSAAQNLGTILYLYPFFVEMRCPSYALRSSYR